MNMAPAHARPGLKTVLDAVSSGDSVAQGMARSGLFPRLAFEMVQVGEKGGRVETVFEQLSEHYANLSEMRRTFLMGILWPAIQFFAAIVIFGLLILALGLVASITNSEPIDLFGLGLSTKGNFILYCSVVSFFLISGFLIVKGLTRGWYGSLPVKVAFRIPVVGPTLQALALSRMAWSLGMAHDAGMDAIETVALSLRATQMDYYMRTERSVRDEIQSGKEMHHALSLTDRFPGEFIETLATGELTGQVSETMDRLSHEYRMRAKSNFQKITAIGAFLIFLLVAIMIGGLVIYLAYTMYIGPLNDAVNGKF